MRKRASFNSTVRMWLRPLWCGFYCGRRPPPASRCHRVAAVYRPHEWTLNVSSWLQAAVRVTAWLRPNYPREPTFATERPLFWIFVGCTPRCGRSGWWRGSSATDPLRTMLRGKMQRISRAPRLTGLARDSSADAAPHDRRRPGRVPRFGRVPCGARGSELDAAHSLQARSRVHPTPDKARSCKRARV